MEVVLEDIIHRVNETKESKDQTTKPWYEGFVCALNSVGLLSDAELETALDYILSNLSLTSGELH